MKTFSFILSLSILIAFSTHPSWAQPIQPPGLEQAPPCVNPTMMPNAARVPCDVLLEFEEGTTPGQRADKVKNLGAHLRFNYSHVNAVAAQVPDLQTLEDIYADSEIKSVIPDRPVSAFPKGGNPGHGNGGGGGGSSGQSTPSGVVRIGAAPGTLPVDGSGVGVAVVDTGVDLNNTDLNVSGSCFTAYSSCEDGHGHGTHVSGIIAALDNEQDVVGVAPGATIYAVKVLSDSGSGSDSNIIAGLDWVADQAGSVNPPIQVANMSLGREGSLNDNPLLRQSVQNLTGMGVTVVVAAGNDESLEVADNVPATYPEVLAVASSTATGGSNQCRWFNGNVPADTASFFTTDGAFDNGTGIGVTVSAPGADKENIKKNCFLETVGILSLKAGGGTTRMSGTSMASPHVAGVAALLKDDSNGALGPEDIRSLIRGYASRIGVAPLDSPASGYSFDGEREGILSACGALGVACP